jgi:hypothetical protein
MTSSRHHPTHARRATKAYAPHLIAQARRVAELLEAGDDYGHISRDLGVSRPRVSQIRSQLHELAPYLGRPDPLDRLRSRRDQIFPNPRSRAMGPLDPRYLPTDHGQGDGVRGSQAHSNC